LLFTPKSLAYYCSFSKCYLSSSGQLNARSQTAKIIALIGFRDLSNAGYSGRPTYQVETDEIYVGIDQRGAHYVFPVQVKGGTDKMSVVQIEQDFALCADKFPTLICRPIGAQFSKNGLIALFEFELGEEGVTIAMERHYRLVKPEAVTPEELETYRNRLNP
jgi:hypothetical protein